MITVTYGDKAVVKLDRSKLLHLFPESLLSQALQGDPEAKEIHLENPLITAEVMKCLQGLLMGELPSVETKILAGDYLNIPMLNLVSREDYPEILETCNYRERKWKYPRLPYKRYIGAGRRLGLVELFRYGLRLMPEDAPPEYTIFLKRKVLFENKVEITQVMLMDSRFPIDCDDIASLLVESEWQWKQYIELNNSLGIVRDYTQTFKLMLGYVSTLDGFENVLQKFGIQHSFKYASCFLKDDRLKAYRDSLRLLANKTYGSF